MSDKAGLRYIGAGHWLHGVPARDLSADEVTEYGGEKDLINSGLYERPSQSKALTGPAENKSKDGE